VITVRFVLSSAVLEITIAISLKEILVGVMHMAKVELWWRILVVVSPTLVRV
jgi:hypothetical protein